MNRLVVLMSSVVSLTLVVFAVAFGAADTVPPYVTTAVADVSRPPGQVALDARRVPEPLVAFSEVKPGDAVLELMPGVGYWTRIFAKLVGPRGHVYSFFVPAVSAGRGQAAAGGAVAPAAPVREVNPQFVPILAIQHTRGYENVLAISQGIGGDGGTLGIPEQADVAWTSGMYHDLHNKVFGELDPANIDKAIYRDLKPGGIFVIVDYAAAAGSGFMQSGPLHRLEKEAVKQEVLSAGFEFVAESNLLARPDDNRTGPAGDAAEQFVLKFRKPKTASAATKRPDPKVAMKNIYGNTFVLGTADKRFRTIFYHPDGTYEEFGRADLEPGRNDMQSAYWFFDADGHNCMLHQYPPWQEGLNICHPWSDAHTNAKLGAPFMEYANGRGSIVTVVKGRQYPNVDQWPKE